MFSPTDFHQEMNRFRRQMNHMFSDFDRSFGMDNDSSLAMPWNQSLGLLEEQNRGREQKELGEQKYDANATGDVAATAGNQMAVETTNPPTSTTTGNSANTAIAPGNTLSTQQRPWGWLTNVSGGSLLPSFNSISIPRVDLVEKDDHFVLNCDLPGMSKEDVKVAVSPNGVLSINAEHSEKHEQKDDKAKYHRIERSYGKYRRSMQLPDNVDADAVKAKHENGLLQLTLPKKSKTEPKATKNVPIQ